MGFVYLLIMLLAGVAIYLASQSMTRVRELQREMRLLRQQMQKNYDELLKIYYSAPRTTMAAETLPAPEQATGGTETPVDAMPLAQSHDALKTDDGEIAHAAATMPHVQEEKTKETLLSETLKTEAELPKASQPAAQKVAQSAAGFEQRFAARLPVWLGGIALAFAGFFMVKYSLEHGLISPKVRMFFSFLFAVGLVFAGDYVRKKGTIANGARIAQALSGSGLAALYVWFYACANFYTFIPVSLAFLGMAGVTATAVILSLRHGVFIALLGLAGGFLTPALFSADEPNGLALFFYLYCVFAGLMFVVRKNGWWFVSVLSTLASFAWALLWLSKYDFSSADGFFVGMFIIAVCMTAVAASLQSYENESAAAHAQGKSLKALNYLALGGALVLWGVLIGRTGFGMLEWGLLFVLSAATIALMFFRPQLFKPFPWLTMAASVVLMVLWHRSTETEFTIILLLFATLFVGSGYALQSRSEKPAYWAALCCVAALIYYTLGLYKLGAGWLDAPYAKGGIALLLAAAATYAVGNLMRNMPEDHADKQKLLSFYAATATAFLAVAAVIELPALYLPLAFALQCLALAWLNARFNIRILRVLAGSMAALYAIITVNVSSITIVLNAALHVNSSGDFGDYFPFFAHPLIMGGLPAVLFGWASVWLRKKQDDGIVNLLEGLSIWLIAATGFVLMRHAFHDGVDVLLAPVSFVERGVMGNAAFLLGALCLWVGQNLKRSIVWSCGAVLYGVALFSTIMLDVLFSNPLWTAHNVGEWWVLNALLLTYAMPVLWLGAALKILGEKDTTSDLHKVAGILMMVLGLVCVTLNVRQMFHGAYLNSYLISNAEIYAYSAAWLLTGAVLLFLGTLRKSKMLRFASMGIIMLTIGKVFLYDASALDGLLRVFSFLGLGVCLLGVSWFYTRFVFGEEKEVGG